jgi:glycosyltransferase involved in cell wall biosynthesis
MSDPPVKSPIAAAPLSVVLTAYESESDLAAIVNDWKAILDGRGGEYEILIVADGIIATVPDDPCVRVLRLDTRRGFGAALRAGIDAARHPLFFYTTADRQYQPADVKLLLDQIDQVDLVSGHRSWQPVPAWLRVIGLVWRVFLRVVMGVADEKKTCWLGWQEERKRFLVRLLFGLRSLDVNCSFRLFRREVFERFPIQCDGAFAQVEVLAKANFLAWLSEVPVRYTPPSREGARYCLEWDRVEIARVFSHPEFRPPVPPQATHPPSPDSGPVPEPSGDPMPGVPQANS